MLRNTITIGIPCHNMVDSIHRTIESLLELNSNKVIIAISDNHSTDGTTQICEKYKTKVKLTVQSENIGQAENLLYLLNNCDSEFFMWLAADDSIQKIQIDQIIKIFDKNPDAVAISPLSYTVYGKQNIIADNGNYSLTGNKLYNLMKFLWRPGVNSRFYSIYRTKVLKETYAEMLDHNCGQYFAADIAHTAFVLSKGSWPLSSDFVLHRLPGASGNGISQRKKNAKSIGTFIFPSTLFITQIVATVAIQHRLIIWFIASILYARYWIGPFKHLYLKYVLKKYDS